MDHALFQLRVTKGLLLLKTADILAIDCLAEKVEALLRGVSADVALTLLVQHGEIHIPGTDESEAMARVLTSLAQLVARRFQPLMTDASTRSLMNRLPVSLIVQILQADDIMVTSENVVLNFVREFITARQKFEQMSGAGDETEQLADAKIRDDEQDPIWQSVRWAFVSPGNFRSAFDKELVLIPHVAMSVLRERSFSLECGAGGAAKWTSPRQPLRPAHVSPPQYRDIDMALYLPHVGKGVGSSPVKQSGDLCISAEVRFSNPPHEDYGSLWAIVMSDLTKYGQTEWNHDGIVLSITVYGWTSSTDKVTKRTLMLKSGSSMLITHVISTSEEMHPYLSPDGFLFVRLSFGDDEIPLRAFQVNR